MRQTQRVTIAVAFALLATLAVPARPAASAAPNSGQVGSTCAASTAGLGFTPPGKGVATSGLGPDAPAYYEIGAPSGAFTGQTPRAIMLVIHGGGWFLVGKEVLANHGRPLANRWRRAGWQTVNVDYGACAQSVADVLWFMQRVRARNPGAVICATGSSAGGHLAMLLATKRADLACAISHAGPTDLLALDGQRSFDASGALTHTGPRSLANMAVAAFGPKPDPLSRYSPMQHVHRVKARVLLATGRTDPLVPRAQDAAFARAIRAARPAAFVEVMSLPPGPAWFVHTGVTADSLTALRLREDALVAPLIAQSGTKVGITG